MNIVVITIPDPVKQSFVHDLQERTGAVSLVVIQRHPPRIWYRRWHNVLHPSHFYYSVLLRLRPALRTALSWFRSVPNQTILQTKWPAPTIWTDNINDPQVKEQIKAHAPKVLAIWGSGLIDDDTIDIAEHTVNLHLGFAPYYRGALANQFAVGCGDMEHIGYTIHYVNTRADAGDIIAARTIPPQVDPRSTFCILNEKARIHYTDVVRHLSAGKQLTKRSQYAEKGYTTRMRDWSPKWRYHLAKRLIHWRRNGTIPRTPLPSYRDVSSER